VTAARRQATRGGPLRNLAFGISFVLTVSACAIAAYMASGWSFGDSLYFTILTVFTVGYDEVRPIDTPMLRAITISLIVLGCSGTIFLTGALVQFITFNQINELLGVRRMKSQIGDLAGHVIICGYGRIGTVLARELAAGRHRLLVLERNEGRQAQAIEHGHLCLIADATDEEALRRAGIERAAVLATVLPDDALNVFITLSARSLNAGLTIIARGEAAATERKLLQAGADRVVMPAYIGAERIAEMIMFPELSSALRAPEQKASASLRQLGIELEVVIAEDGARFVGHTVAEIEREAENGFLILAVQDAQAESAVALVARTLSPETIITAGSGVTLVLRAGQRVALEGFRTATGA